MKQLFVTPWGFVHASATCPTPRLIPRFRMFGFIHLLACEPGDVAPPSRRRMSCVGVYPASLQVNPDGTLATGPTTDGTNCQHGGAHASAAAAMDIPGYAAFLHSSSYDRSHPARQHRTAASRLSPTEQRHPALPDRGNPALPDGDNTRSRTEGRLASFNRGNGGRRALGTDASKRIWTSAFCSVFSCGPYEAVRQVGAHVLLAPIV